MFSTKSSTKNVASAQAALASPLSLLTVDERKRVLMTAGCRDCDSIPKVPGAGQTFDSESGSERYQRMHNGIRIVEDCYCGRWMTELIRLLEGHHEPQEERVFHELLQYVPRGGTMLELGSWWAYYSLWFQSRVPDAKLYLVEPDPRRLEDGKRNFALNGARGSFFLGSIGRDSHAPLPFRCEDGSEFAIPQYSVDDFLTQRGIDRVEILLADIQGAELEMLESASKSMQQGKIRFLVLSTHHHSISHDPLTHQRCLKILQQGGAHIMASHSISESYSGDGLIVASLDPRDRGLPTIEMSCNRASNNLFRELEYDLAEALGSQLEGPRTHSLGAASMPRRTPWYRRILKSSRSSIRRTV